MAAIVPEPTRAHFPIDLKIRRRALRSKAVECDDAPLAGLHYTTDQEPGITRHKAKKSFSYKMPNGSAVRDKETLARIAAIVIPPAWTDVWISTDPSGHLQATGRDARGRKQYRYHPAWREHRDGAKYHRLQDFGLALPKLRRTIDNDLHTRGLNRTKVIAAVVHLLERTLIRVGNDEYARVNDSYGLTTLRDDHVDVSGASVRFSFRGKSGKEHEVALQDRRLSRIVRSCRDLPGQTLFQYRDESGETHAIGSADVNDYIRQTTGGDFTAKDMRTWFGTVIAAGILRRNLETEQDERPKQIVATIKEVAGELGNTVSVCRKCYVHPLVIDAYMDGRFDEIARSFRSRSARWPGHSDDERLVLRILQRLDG